MLYLTRTPDLVVEVNNREGVEVEKLVKETAINVIQRGEEINERRHYMTFRLHPIIIVKINRDWHN